MSSQKKKVTLYFNAAMLSETQKEALRQDRSVSWIIQAAWRIARDEIRRMPGALSSGAPVDRRDDADPDDGEQVAAAQAGSASLSGSAPRPV
jgi:uncharacterized small protein (TIGR04563 family)